MKGRDGLDGGTKRGPAASVWRAALAAAVMAVVAVAADFLKIPLPGVVLLAGVTVFAALYGFGAGAACAAVTVVYSMYDLSAGHGFRSYSAENLQQLAVIVLAAVVNALFVGHLRSRCAEAERRLKAAPPPRRDDDLSLAEASVTDVLTGTRNRTAIRREYGSFENRHVHVMRADLDDFKRLNDAYGQAVGDYILKKAGAVMMEVFGKDRCYRYEGDEFLVICPDVDEALFPNMVERLRKGVNGIHLNDKHLAVRLSAGYAFGVCEQPDDLRLMMHQADDNLRRAKAGGKDNCVKCAYSRTAAQALRGGNAAFDDL